MILTYIPVFIGITFILIASIGIIRMPDVYCRMSAVSKAITFGIGFILLGVAIEFNDTATFLKVVVTYVFLSLSTSVASSVIALAAYKDKKARLSDLTFLDEMSEHEKNESPIAPKEKE
jgi:multicomponent Na+:H+ antiporter subunit G